MNFSKNVKKQKKDGRLISSICVAPYDVFEINGLLKGEKAIGHLLMKKLKIYVMKELLFLINVLLVKALLLLLILVLIWQNYFFLKMKLKNYKNLCSIKFKGFFLNNF